MAPPVVNSEDPDGMESEKETEVVQVPAASEDTVRVLLGKTSFKQTLHRKST